MGWKFFSWKHADIRLCNALLVGISMMMSGYFGWAIMGGDSAFAAGMAVLCAIICYLVSYFAQDVSTALARGNIPAAIPSAAMLAVAIAFNVVSDYSTASIWRDYVVVETDNTNTIAANARREVQRIEKTMADLQAETAWRTKYEAPETYDALILQQKQIVDRGRNVWQRTGECTDTTLEVSSRVCQEIARLEADKANAERRQVILAELRTLGEQLAQAKSEVAGQQVVSNPALAQVRSITTWFLLDRETSERSDWWGAKSIMLYMTILGTAVIVYLGFRIGQLRSLHVGHADERDSWAPRVALPPSPNHAPQPIPLRAEPAPSRSSSYHETVSVSVSGQSDAMDRLQAIIAQCRQRAET